MAHKGFQEGGSASLASSLRWALLRLFTAPSFGLNLTIFNVFRSNFSDLASKVSNPSAIPQNSRPVDYIFVSPLLLEVSALHQEYYFGLTLGQDVYHKAVCRARAVRIPIP